MKSESIFNEVQFGGLLLALEVFLVWVVFVAVAKLLQKNGKSNRNGPAQLARLLDFRPEPLCSEVDPAEEALHPLIISDKIGHYICVDDKKCLNLATHNYFNLLGNKDIENNAIQVLRKYGVGSCGPRGFYGSIDIHLDLETCIAEFMGMEEAIVYSYGFSTVASAISAYCKHSDVIFCDEKISFASQKGMDAARSTVYYFKHNDTSDLEAQLEKFNAYEAKFTDQKNYRRKRKFLIIEGIYINTGEMCPLPKLVEISKKNQMRIFLDETISFGAVGETGRGVTELLKVNRSDVDLIMGSMDFLVASVGGFCLGSSYIIEHQRLSGLGYCFSASLPPLLSSAGINALTYLNKHPEMIRKLNSCSKALGDKLRELKYVEIIGHPFSPVKHLILAGHQENARKKLKELSDLCMKDGLALCVAAYLECEKHKPVPSIRITASVSLEQDEIDFVCKTIAKNLEIVV